MGKKKNPAIRVKRKRAKKKNPYINLIFGASMILIFAIMAVFADKIAPYHYTVALFEDKLQAPSLTHLFGTDAYGRDLFSRVIYGIRLAFKVAGMSIAIQMILGVGVGIISGYFGGIVDRILSFVMEVLMSIPTLVFAFAVVTVMGRTLDNTVIAISLVSWPGYARVIRTKTIEIKNAAYIKIARTYGESTFSIMFRYILPNLVPSIVVLASTRIPGAIVSTTSMSFLGLGAQSPSPDWGLALSDATKYVMKAPWLCIFPGLALILFTYMFSILGDGIRDVFDPNLKGS